MARIGRKSFLVDYYKDELEGLGEAGEDDTDTQAEWRMKFKGLLAEAENAIDTLGEFHSEVTKYWSTESQRVVGHIA